jgi:hypothetical protein
VVNRELERSSLLPSTAGGGGGLEKKLEENGLELRWSLAHWFVILRLRLKKVFKKCGFHGVKRARH